MKEEAEAKAKAEADEKAKALEALKKAFVNIRAMKAHIQQEPKEEDEEKSI